MVIIYNHQASSFGYNSGSIKETEIFNVGRMRQSDYYVVYTVPRLFPVPGCLSDIDQSKYVVMSCTNMGIPLENLH